jgi:hypothetical protein
MNSHSKFLIATISLLTPVTIQASGILTNGDFEVGAPITAANQFTTFAGSPARDANWSPIIAVDEWMVSALTQPHPLLLENTGMAKSGNRFLYLIGGSFVGLKSFDGAGPGLLVQGNSVGGSVVGGGSPLMTFDMTTADVIQVGTTYHLSFWAANAGSSVGGVPAAVALNMLGASSSFTLDINPNWQDSTTSIIPWQQISYDFTVTSNQALWNLELLLARPAGTAIPTGSERTAMVIDNIQLTVVPEPNSAALCGTLLMGLKRRRAHPSK